MGLVAASGLALGACGSDDETRSESDAVPGEPQTATVARPRVPPQAIDGPAPVSLAPAERARFVAGRDIARLSGCLACHRIGTTGSDDPGSNLTGIGERRSPAEIRRVLVDPQVAMPAYDELPADHLDALVTFLSALREDSCPDDSDCG